MCADMAASSNGFTFQRLGHQPDPLLVHDLDDDSPAPAPTAPSLPLDRGHSRKQQYPGCWSHTERQDLKAPRSMSKGAFGELLLRLVSAVFRSATADGARRVRENRLERVSVFQERHENGEIHYHFIVLAELPWCFVALVRALRAESICVEMTTSHDYYWTSFVYLCVPGADPNGKAESDLDMEPWLSPGHPSKKETVEAIPRGARASDKARVRRYLAAETGEPTTKEVALTDKDFAAHVVAKGFKSLLQFQAWVTTTRARVKADRHALPKDEHMTFIGMEAYMFKYQGDLAKRLNFAWETHSAPSVLARQTQSAWSMLVAASSEMQCVCGGRWIPAVEELLDVQVRAFDASHLPEEIPTAHAIKSAVRRALQGGSGKRRNVYFYGPKDAGKSFMLKPIIKIFDDHCFTRPVGKANNYPLQDLFGKKVVVLQDLRLSTYRLPFDARRFVLQGWCTRPGLFWFQAPYLPQGGGGTEGGPEEAG